jgi:peptidyl-prolyl cis-trans isomerase C
MPHLRLALSGVNERPRGTTRITGLRARTKDDHMTRLLTGAAIALALAAPLLPSAARAQDASTVLATVNGTEITLGHLIAMQNRLPDQYRQLPDDVLYEGMLDQIIQQQVLADAAMTELSAADEIALENERRAFLAARVIDTTAEQPLDEADVQAAYDERYAEYDAVPEFNASHILVETEAEAQEIISDLEGGADFAELARERSTGPSGPSGGELGWFGPGQMVPEFEAAVQGLEPAGVSAPVQTQFGWHVVRLNDRRDRGAPALDEVRGELEQPLRQQAVSAELDRLVAEAEVDRAEVEIDPALIREDGLLE